MPRSRYGACHLLRRHNIDCAIWFEDAPAHLGVTTIIFDLYLFVPDIERTAEPLRHHQWQAARVKRTTNLVAQKAHVRW